MKEVFYEAARKIKQQIKKPQKHFLIIVFENFISH